MGVKAVREDSRTEQHTNCRSSRMLGRTCGISPALLPYCRMQGGLNDGEQEKCSYNFALM